MKNKPVVIDYVNCPANDCNEDILCAMTETIEEADRNEYSFELTKKEADEVYEGIQNGTLNHKLFKIIKEIIITNNECGATLKVKYYKCDADEFKKSLTKLRAFDMLGWNEDLEYYFDETYIILNDTHKLFEYIELNFGYELIKWGQYVILVGGFSG